MQIVYPRTNRQHAEAAEAESMGTEVRRTAMLRDLARMDVPHPLAQDGESETAPAAAEGYSGISDVTSLIQRANAASIAELDKTILDLQRLRDFLQSEGERMHQEMTNYLRLSHAAMGSTKTIADTMLSLAVAARVDRDTVESVEAEIETPAAPAA
jgi:hypothetical protein